MRLTFSVDPRHVIAHAMRSLDDYDLLPGWDALMDTVYRPDPHAFALLAGMPEFALPSSQDVSLPALAKRAERMLASILRTPVARRLVRETRASMRLVREEWRRNGAWTLAQLRELTRLTLPNETIRVFITHPSLGNGRAVDPHTIVWGSTIDVPNASTIYLAHELLHILTWDDQTDVGHAAIELLADNELRTRLNGGGRYFTLEGHANLLALERTLLPAWRRYLRTPTQDFRDFIRAHA